MTWTTYGLGVLALMAVYLITGMPTWIYLLMLAAWVGVDITLAVQKYRKQAKEDIWRNYRDGNPPWVIS